MHTVVIKEEILERHPWLAQSLMKAFTEAKALCVQAIANVAALSYMLPWMMADVEEMIDLMGDNPWPYGVDENRATIGALLGYLRRQGLAERPINVDELFATSTCNSYRL
jgi:4,5-dihydroxyphthalate decarboxylase